MAADQERLQRAALTAVRDEVTLGGGRRPDLDQLARQVLLATASDWAFMVSRDTAASYARARFAAHRDDADALLAALRLADGSARPLAASQRRTDGPFGQLDARLLAGA
jgi:1,4-alpha-glucan branching enzyme